jgi:copper transport protein
MRRASGGLAGPARVAAALLLLLASASVAFAHAALIRSDPSEGAILAAAPESFRLVFNEPVALLLLKLLAPDGRVETLTGAQAEGATLLVPAPAGMGRGPHALSWRVVSEDGHPIGGTLAFSIGEPGEHLSRRPEADGTAPAALWATRFALFFGLLFGAGGAFARSWLFDGGAAGSRLSGPAMALGLAAAALSLGLQGADALAAPLGSLFAPDVWRAGGATAYVRTVAVASAALLCGLLALRLRGAPARAASAVALIGAGAALAASGHASTAEPRWLATALVALHGAGVSFWIGALAPLGSSLRTGGEEAAAALRRFSAAAPYALAALALAGLALAAVQLRSPAALFDSAYGRVLLAKAALLTALFGVAALNRWRLTAPAVGGAARRRLVRSIAVEIGLAAVILGVVALWRFTPPPRALADAAPARASLHVHGPRAMAEVTVEPGPAGLYVLSASVLTADSGALDAKEATAILSNEKAGIEPIRRRLRRGPDGLWRSEPPLPLPVRGRWALRLDLLISDFESVRLDGELEIGP